jgi:hypothetical protein
MDFVAEGTFVEQRRAKPNEKIESSISIFSVSDLRRRTDFIFAARAASIHQGNSD